MMQEMLARLLIAVVLFINLQSAVLFLVNPGEYVGGFGLNGFTGEQMLRGMGVLFIMWNVPYVFALVKPVRSRVIVLAWL